MAEKKVGIYCITCTVNGKQYVGQSIDIDRRKNQHKSKAENPRLRADIEKYGWDAFEFEILELCKEEELNARETYYLNLLKPEYNIRTEGNAISEEARQKLRESKLGKKRPEISKPVKCVETGEIFPSVTAAAEFCNLRTPDLSMLLAGKGRTFGGYHWIWVYDDEEQEQAALERIEQMPEGHKHTDETREKQRQAKLGKKMSPECCEKMRESHTGKKWKPSTYEKCCRKILCVETGKIFLSIKSAADEYCLKAPNISAVLSGRKNTAGGYHWQYVDGRPPGERSESMRRKLSKAVRCVETGDIFFSIHSAAEACGVTDGAISAVLRGRNETSGGYHWEFVEEESK